MTGLTLLLFTTVSWAQQPATRPADVDEQAVREAVSAYAEAFNRGDSEAIGRFFTNDAQYVFEDGSLVKGRENIQKQLAQTLTDRKGARLEIRVESVQSPRSRIAMVRAVSALTDAEGASDVAPFRANYVKREGKWLIRTAEEFSEVGQALDQLSGFIGSWVDEDSEATIRNDWQWTSSRRFITRTFSATLRSGRQMGGTEVIGWDPASRTIRSWMFDADGGFGQGIWSSRGEGVWIIKSRGVLPDGSRASDVRIVQLESPDKYTWQSISREVDGEILPDIGPVTIVRAQTQPADAALER